MTVRIMVGDALAKLKELPDESVHCVVTSPPYWGLRSYKGDTGMIGLEPTFAEHLDNLVAVFREVRRVLRSDGVCFVNYGDSYWSGGPNNFGWKAKDLMGMPALVATELMKDGYYRRSEIIWHKPNPMPESCTDRPTSAHEKLFLLSKSARYFYDAEAVKVPAVRAGDVPGGRDGTDDPFDNRKGWVRKEVPSHANLRNVWKIATHAYSEAHFATFPPALVEPCIKAGTSEKGVCGECGAPWVREVSRDLVKDNPGRQPPPLRSKPDGADQGNNRARDGHLPGSRIHVETVGWHPTCDHDAPTAPATCLDIFAGSGTVGLVADRLGRDAILIEISPEYAEMARKRIDDDAGLFA